MSGVGAVSPKDFRGEYNFATLLRGSVRVEQELKSKEPLHKRLLEAALSYLRQANICFPHATLEVRQGDVVMHGVPHTGQLLVCAVEGDGIYNYIEI